MFPNPHFPSLTQEELDRIPPCEGAEDAIADWGAFWRSHHRGANPTELTPRR